MQPILTEFEFLKDAEVNLSFVKNDKSVSEIEFIMNHEY